MFNSSGLNEKEGLAYGFKVSMSGQSKSSQDSSSILFNSCEGIQSEIEVQFLNDGAALDRALPVRGRKSGGIITFSRGVAESGSAANDFFSWFDAVCDSSRPLKKKILNIMLIDTNEQGKILARWEVKGAWPCRWHGPYLDVGGSSPTVERLSFAYETIKKAS